MLRNGLFPVRVEGDSMLPGLPPGARVAARPVMTDLHPGMIVVAQRPDRPAIEMVKRIAAVPGQMVTTRDGARYRLEPDQFFLVGDNPAASTDSRHFGPVPRVLIRAVARWRYWPLPPRRL